MATGIFLKPEDLETFQQDRSAYARQVLALPDAEKASLVPLEEVVQERVRYYLTERAHGFYCMGIEVFPGDGMSWSATSADAAIQEAGRTVPCLYLRGRAGAGPFPALAEAMSMRRIALRAQMRGVAVSARLLGTRRYAAIILAAVALGAAGSLATVELSGGGFSSARLTLPFLGIAVIAGCIGIASQLLFQRLGQEPGSSPLVRIAEDIERLANAGQPGDAYWSFIDDLAAELGKFAEFRCVIVDDFTNLDKTTRYVLEAYLKNIASDRKNEFWILFYSTDDKRLEFLVNRPERTNRKPTGYRHTHLFRLEHLATDQRRQLAISYGAPERAASLTVRAITRDHGEFASLASLCRREHDYRRSQPQKQRRGDVLDFFYIFALNASWAGNPWMSSLDIRSTFSRQRRFRSPLFQLLMPGHAASPTAISQSVDEMLATFFPLAGEISGQGQRRRFFVDAEAGRYLSSSWREFGLVNPEVVHLFWAVYWSDTELQGTANVALLRKVTHHLLRAADLSKVAASLRIPKAEVAAFNEELFNTALELLRGCLKACLLTDVPDLLRFAMRLSEDDRESAARRRRARLRPLAWQAYGLLGDERLLSVIFDLDPATGTVDSSAPGQSCLTDLFAGSIPRADGEVSELMRRQLASHGVARQIAAYTEGRAGWLAASLTPFLRQANPILMAAADECRQRLPELVGSCVGDLEAAAEQEWRTTEIQNAALGLWSLALMADSSRAATALARTHSEDADAALVDALVRTCVLAIELSEQRRSADPSPAALDLVLDCLAEEILSVVLTAAIVVLHRWPDDAWTSRVVRQDVVDVAAESGRALGISEVFLPSAGEALEPRLIVEARRRMTLLAVLWRRLGFAQMSSLMAVREAQLEATYYRHDAELAQTVLESLGPDLEQANFIGLLAHLSAAEGAGFSEELEAWLLLRVSQLSVSAGFSDQLTAELCMIALEAGHSYEADLSACVDFLLARPGGTGKRRLEVMLAPLAPDVVTRLVLVLLNVVIGDNSERADIVRAILEQRVAEFLPTADPDLTKRTEAYFRTFAVRRHTLAGHPVDVDIELDAWENLRDTAWYAYLLNLLLPISRQHSRERVVTESLAVLKAKDPYITTSGYVYLAESLFMRLRNDRSAKASGDADTALTALRDGFNRLEKYLPAERNVGISRVLSHYYRDQENDYAAKYLEWQKVVLELDEAHRLPELVTQGRFFLLIWHYFEFFAYYGLASDPPTDHLGLDETEIVQALADWTSGQRVTPEPILGSGDGERLSGEFLRIGYALFAPSPNSAKATAMTSGELEDARQQVDQKARDAIESLYGMLRRLPGIPESIEQILRRHEVLVLAQINDFSHNSMAI